MIKRLPLTLALCLLTLPALADQVRVSPGAGTLLAWLVARTRRLVTRRQ